MEANVNVYMDEAMGTETDNDGHLRCPGLERMQDSYAAAMAACDQGSDHVRALLLFTELQNIGAMPCRNDYNTAIKACGALGQHYQKSILLIG